MKSPISLLLLTLVSGLLTLRANAQVDEAAARRLLDQARTIAQSGDLLTAAREYRLVRDRFPGSATAAEALLAEATIHQNLGNTARAREVAVELVDSGTRSSAVAGAMVLLAELDLADATSREVLDRLRTELARIPLLFGPDEYPQLAARAQSRILLAQLALRGGETDRAVGLLLAAAENEPASDRTNRARVDLATAFVASGQWASGTWWAQRVLESAVDGPDAEVARTLLATVERLQVRVSRGLPAYRSTRQVAPAGVDLGRDLALAGNFGERFLVADDRNAVREITATGQVSSAFAAAEPVAVVYDAAGIGWVVLPTGLVEVGGRGRRVTFTSPEDPEKSLDRIVDAAPDAWGGWFVLDGRKDRVLRADPTGRPLGQVDGVGSRPIAVAADGLGRLYVLDRKAAMVSRRAENGAVVPLIRGTWRDAVDLATDRFGRVAVLDASGPRIDLFGPDGAPLATIGENLPGGGVLQKPTAIGLDGAGRLAIADRKAAAIVVLE